MHFSIRPLYKGEVVSCRLKGCTRPAIFRVYDNGIVTSFCSCSEHRKVVLDQAKKELPFVNR